MIVWINNFPLAPSVNNSLIPIAGKLVRNKYGKLYRQGRMIKSNEAKVFDQMCHYWALQNSGNLSVIKNELKKIKMLAELKREPFALKVECFVVFEYGRIFTVNKKAEQLDADNRLKKTLDGLKIVLGIDDKTFFSSSCEKVTTHSKELECAMIRISLMRPRTREDIKAMMDLESRAKVS